MAHRLDGVRAKLNRATKHRRELNTKVRAFLASKPYRIVHEPHDDPAYLGWHRGVFRIVQNPPIELGVIAGEVFDQYRSALDHLMTQLIALRGPGRANFPIYPEGRFWVPASKGDRRSPRERIATLIRPEHLAIIERLQPRESQPIRSVTSIGALLVTQWVSDFDKHELVRPGFLSPRSMGMSASLDTAWVEWVIDPLANLYDRAELYRVKFMTEEQVEVPFRLEPDLTFGALPYPWLPVQTIRICGRRIREIVRRFVRVTPEFA